MGLKGAIARYKRLQQRLEALPEAIGNTIEYNKEQLLDLRKDEILLGRNSDGEPFTPGYTNDPYFKTPAAANAYAVMKDRLLGAHNIRIQHPLNYPQKGNDTPNLIVKGDFQDAMFIRTSGDSFDIGSTYNDANDISQKYGGKVYNPGPEAKRYFWQNILLPALRLHITKK